MHYSAATVLSTTNNHGRDDATSANLTFHASKEWKDLINGKCHALHKWCLSNHPYFIESRKRTLKELKNNSSSKSVNSTKDSNSKESGRSKA